MIGHTYMQTIKLLNITDLPQTIKIIPLDYKIFKFPKLTTVSYVHFFLMLSNIVYWLLYNIRFNLIQNTFFLGVNSSQ